MLRACVADKFDKLHPEGPVTHCRFLLAASLRRDALMGTRSGEGSIQRREKKAIGVDLAVEANATQF